MKQCNAIGRIHSIETFGTVDGPGIRFVVFMQGCPMRCRYCHNPDTWSLENGTEMTISEILDKLKNNLPFYRNGGITVSGGEPLLQKEFVTQLFYQAKLLGLHTALDTSGILFEVNQKKAYSDLLSVTDLVMLDIKQIDARKHRELCGFDNKNVLAFLNFLSEKKVDVQIRYVLVPGLTDDETDLSMLGKHLSTFQNIKALEVLPYHTLGVKKYKELGLSYHLEHIPQATKEASQKARNIIINALKK